MCSGSCVLVKLLLNKWINWAFYQGVTMCQTLWCMNHLKSKWIFVFMIWWERQILNKWPIRIVCGGHHLSFPLYTCMLFFMPRRGVCSSHLESELTLISWPKQRGKSDVLELLRPTLKKLCSFYLGFLECFLLGWSLSKPSHYIVKNSSHMERVCVGPA